MTTTTATKSPGQATSHIKQLLNSSSARVFNTQLIAQTLQRTQPEAPLLFRTPILNKCIFLKELVSKESAIGTFMRVGTKIYIPFDGSMPEEGGNTFVYSPSSLPKILGSVIDLSAPGRMESIQADNLILAELDELPAFSPFLIRECFERAGIVANPLYSVIPADEWNAIRLYIRLRFEEILSAVTGAEPTHASLNHLLDKLWDLNDRPTLEGLAAAFGLPKANCLETFYAWKGTLYFSWLSVKLNDDVRVVTDWLQNGQAATGLCPPQHRAALGAELQALRQLVFHELSRMDEVQMEYDMAFDELFVRKSGSTKFVHFLGNAQSYFHACGAAIGTLQHVHEVWDRMTVRHPGRMPGMEVMKELISVLQDILKK